MKKAFSSLSGNKDIYILYIKSTIEVLDIVKCTVTRPLTLQGFILVHLIMVDRSSYIFSHRNRIKGFLAALMFFLLKVLICPKFTQIEEVNAKAKIYLVGRKITSQLFVSYLVTIMLDKIDVFFFW